jgi:streptogrisin D
VRLTRSALRRRVCTIAVAGLVAGSLFTPSFAEASATSFDMAAASTLAERFGDRTAGTYLDANSGKMVVTVTDAATAAQVQAAGAVARFVPRSAAQLASAAAELDRSTWIPGTSWAVDPMSNQVVVSADSSVTGAKLTHLTSVISHLGDAARLEHVAGRFSIRIRGGNAIFGAGFRCSLGFNVRSGDRFFFLTAGHCESNTFSDGGGNTIGSGLDASFPGNDYAIAEYEDGVSHPGAVTLFNGSNQDITRSANAFVGERVTRSGSTSGVHSGTVLAVNATVTYPEGRVTGLIRTNVCAEGGDSGGPLFDGSTALGLTSGGSGNCSRGGIIFFQPVTEALNVYGVRVY